jgi:hypothetical protein
MAESRPHCLLFNLSYALLEFPTPTLGSEGGSRQPRVPLPGIDR